MEQRRFLPGLGRHGEFVRLPRAYRQNVRWIPHIGDIFPDFDATTTQGPIRFYDWAEGSWTVLFSQPGAFTPVCTTELASLARAEPEFTARNTKLIGLTRDSTEDQSAWCAEVEILYDTPIAFPLIEDLTGILTNLCGMQHPKESTLTAIRKTFIIDPGLRIRMIFEYPSRIGRNTAELLRSLDALQHHDVLDVATPSDWKPGNDYLVPSAMSNRDADACFGQSWRAVNDYLRLIDSTGLFRHREVIEGKTGGGSL
ncbi:alkyl hydroperoxide reductase subunit AhpC [Rhodovulum iodosum]|uniref:Alkyl hydroperoxide reductase C n=1 Tax=Rhodovulum iodosum TaxID=68291 RepID=A0ABV3XPK1_9RHOB|nr:redoxin domain-containing protein [Rhodovulum robiginosum]RSK31460.1 redoxin domain-containing protein [Rhodovulum robiginosum]